MKKIGLVPMPSTRFLRVKCQCGNEQTTFSAATTRVKCLKCDTQLLEPGASKATLQAKVLKEFN